MEYVTAEGIIVTNRIFVGSIPDWITENKLHLAFQDLNFDVQSTRIVVDMFTGQRKGYGFVTFYDPNAAMELIKKGSVVTKDGVKLKIDTAVRRKGLQLRLQKQKDLIQSAINRQYGLNSTLAENSIYSAQTAQTQMQYLYPASVLCKCTTNVQPAMPSHQAAYHNYSIPWQNQDSFMSHSYC